jgi:ABC-2 type transport system ATP-binding protein
MTTSAITLTELRKTYPASKKFPAKEALKGISLEVPRGAFFGLLGPNGAGKSTLINILSGLVNKTSGTAEICGYDIEKEMRKARLSIGVVPQELVLDTFFTVREALEIHAGYYGIPQSARRTSEIIAAMGLEDKADVPSRRLSGGMRRRLLIGKALVHSPEVLILDEPTAGVDVELREQLWAYVRKLNEAGTTILLTTHYLEEAQELCDDIAIINHGEVITRASKKDLLARVDSKQLQIKLSKPLGEVPASLKIEGCSVDAEGQLMIHYQPSKTSFDQLFASLQSAGLEVHDITTHQADLEDIFRQLTAA